MYLAVDKDGTEWIFEDAPERHINHWHVFDPDRCVMCVEVPKGTILRLIGRELRWEDNAEEVTEYK